MYNLDCSTFALFFHPPKSWDADLELIANIHPPYYCLTIADCLKIIPIVGLSTAMAKHLHNVSSKFPPDQQGLTTYLLAHWTVQIRRLGKKETRELTKAAS